MFNGYDVWDPLFAAHHCISLTSEPHEVALYLAENYGQISWIVCRTLKNKVSHF